MPSIMPPVMMAFSGLSLSVRAGTLVHCRDCSTPEMRLIVRLFHRHSGSV